jgi:hypothetical protein
MWVIKVVVYLMLILICFLLISRRAAIAREERKNGMPKLLEFFQEMRTQNECFYYEVQLDENNVLHNVFWRHASQHAEYVDFGDVVTFDTTYQTNIYRMPLAIFVGFEPSAAKCHFWANSVEQWTS